MSFFRQRYFGSTFSNRAMIHRASPDRSTDTRIVSSNQRGSVFLVFFHLYLEEITTRFLVKKVVDGIRVEKKKKSEKNRPKHKWTEITRGDMRARGADEDTLSDREWSKDTGSWFHPRVVNKLNKDDNLSRSSTAVKGSSLRIVKCRHRTLFRTIMLPRPGVYEKYPHLMASGKAGNAGAPSFWRLRALDPLQTAQIKYYWMQSTFRGVRRACLPCSQSLQRHPRKFFGFAIPFTISTWLSYVGVVSEYIAVKINFLSVVRLLHSFIYIQFTTTK